LLLPLSSMNDFTVKYMYKCLLSIGFRTREFDENQSHFAQTLYLYVVTFQIHLHMEYLSISWYDIAGLVVPIMISRIYGCC